MEPLAGEDSDGYTGQSDGLIKSLNISEGCPPFYRMYVTAVVV